jgi:hypothetical protein
MRQIPATPGMESEIAIVVDLIKSETMNAAHKSTKANKKMKIKVKDGGKKQSNY